MSESKKTTFGAEEQKPVKEAKTREELAVLWERTDKHGNKYISMKLKVDKELRDQILSQKELNCKFFKNKRKSENDSKPDYVAFKDTQKIIK